MASTVFKMPDEELIYRFLCYAVLAPPDDELLFDSEVLDPLQDRFKGEDICHEFRRYDVTCLRLVCKAWDANIRRVRDRYGAVEFFRWGVKGNLREQKPMLRRLLIVAPFFAQTFLPQFRSTILRAPGLVRLHVDLRLRTIGEAEAIEKGLNSIIHSTLHAKKLKVLRWSGPPIDILRCASGTYIERLILDDPPLYEIDDTRPIFLPYLTHVNVRLPYSFNNAMPSSKVLSVLCQAHTPALISLSVTCASELPHLHEFLERKGDLLTRLRIKERPWSNEISYLPLPPLSSLRSCGLQFSAVRKLLSDTTPRTRLAVLELYGFSYFSLRNGTTRAEVVAQLFDACRFLYDNKPDRFPNLRIVRLEGLKSSLLYRVEFSRYDYACLTYAFKLLNRRGTLLVTEDETPLSLVSNVKKRAVHFLEYDLPISPLAI